MRTSWRSTTLPSLAQWDATGRGRLAAKPPTAVSELRQPGFKPFQPGIDRPCDTVVDLGRKILRHALEGLAGRRSCLFEHNRWNLNSSYPMTAPEFAAARRAVAVKSGLGRKPGQKRGRRKKFG